MADPAVIEAQLVGLPDVHARLLRVRTGLADGDQKTAPEAAAALGMSLDDYRVAERDAFLALRGRRV